MGAPTTRRMAPVTPDDALLDAAARVFDLGGALSGARRGNERGLLAEAEARLDAFEAAAGALPLPRTVLRPARLTLGALLDETARANGALDIRAWTAGARKRLFDGRDVGPETLAEFRRVAEREGAAYAPLVRLIDTVDERIARLRWLAPRRPKRRWRLAAAAALLAIGCAMAGWVAFLDYRHGARLWSEFKPETAGLAASGETGLAARLDRLAEAAAHAEAAAAAAPLARAAGWRTFDAGARARAAYAEAVAATVPPALARALDDALATEGDDLALYDALRARAILDGTADWSAAYIRGWALDRAAKAPELAGLAPHIGALAGAPRGLPHTDPELVAQARGFAAATGEADRAWLELRRSAEAATLAPWDPTEAVTAFEDVFVRHSGQAVDAPVDGLFTTEGWAWARDFGAGIAVREARSQAADLLGPEARQANDTPDRVLDRLQRETVRAWETFLADLRVRSFEDQERALLVSGALSSAASPLEALLRATWVEAGGTDRQRSHEQQLAVAKGFGPLIQYVEQGRMEEIGQLFAALNVALARIDVESGVGAEALMGVEQRGRSIRAMQAAPAVVVAIVEDVLAQTSAAQADLVSDPLLRAWETSVLPVCRAVVSGRYPFAAGPDADPGEVAALLGPGGAIERFFRANLASLIDAEASPWRWKPEVRFRGFAPESAAFLERALALSAALFSESAGLEHELTLSALAERGVAIIAVGGAGGPVRAGGEPLALAWPGPDPARGAEVSFQSGGTSETVAEPGPWGLLRLLETLRVRPRDGGQRHLVDLRTETGRLFLEIGFAQRANPLTARTLIEGFDCPGSL